MAWEMLDLNNMLPLHFTENLVDRKIFQLYWKRTSFFNGIVWDPEFSGRDMVQTADYITNPNAFE